MNSLDLAGLSKADDIYTKIRVTLLTNYGFDIDSKTLASSDNGLDWFLVNFIFYLHIEYILF